MTKKLLFSVTIKDCEIQTFCSGGPGGQHQNKTQSGVRIIHKPSGATGESREHREQLQNKKAAFERMAKTKKFQNWIRLESARRLGKPSIEEQVEETMKPSNIKTEGKDENDRWVEIA